MKRLNSKYSILTLLTIFIFTFFSCDGVFAQSTDNEAQSEQISEYADQPSELDLRMQKTVSIDVSDVPIELVIKQLAEQVNVDFVLSPNVTGNVTVTLTDVTVEEALQSILDDHGCSFMKGKNVVRILPREEMPVINERLVTQTFEIIYADVEQVVDALQKFLSSQGRVSYVKGTSYLIVTDTEPKVREIAKLIEKIDRITPQVLVEVRIYDITCKDNLDLGIDWYASRRTNFSGGYFSDSDITVSKDGAATYIDSRTDPAIIGTFSGGTNKTADSTTGYLRFGVLNRHVDLDAQLRAEKENIDAKLLANPRILVIDNETAVFDIVTEHPYVERTINGSNITETVKFKNVGTKLEVTPQVARDGKLRLHIMPEFGIVVGSVQVSSSTVPIVDTRKVDTTALVDDGQAVVLGGLRKKETTKQVNKVPLLSNIPILGNLCKFEGETTSVAELVVFITPKIITEPLLSNDEQNAFDATQFGGPAPGKTKAEKAGFGM
ncbi:MAG: secretin N-terminal domain-containing protein [Sedimentisphaerales bacterium]